MTALLIFGIMAATGDLPRNGLDEVVGSYYHGDGLGTNCTITIEVDGRFSYQWRGCLGVYEKNEGRVEVAGGRVLLHPEGYPTPRLKTGYIPVQWDERLYLIVEDQLAAFRRSVELGDEPRTGAHGWFFLRRGDWDKKVQGQPDLDDYHPRSRTMEKVRWRGEIESRKEITLWRYEAKEIAPAEGKQDPREMRLTFSVKSQKVPARRSFNDLPSRLPGEEPGV